MKKQTSRNVYIRYIYSFMAAEKRCRNICLTPIHSQCSTLKKYSTRDCRLYSYGVILAVYTFTSPKQHTVYSIHIILYIYISAIII